MNCDLWDHFKHPNTHVLEAGGERNNLAVV